MSTNEPLDLPKEASAVSALCRKRQRQTDEATRLVVLFAPLVCAAVAVTGLGINNPILTIPLLTGTVAVFVRLIDLVVLDRGSRYFEQVQSLTREWNPSVCGTLIEVLGQDQTSINLSVESLRFLVPRMTEEHFLALDAVQRDEIRRYVSCSRVLYQFHENWLDVQFALCRLVTDYGDRKDLTALKLGANWANRKIRRPIEEELIPMMEARLKEEARTDQLLRASEQPGRLADDLLRASADTELRSKQLLRPAAGVETQPEQLLRPK